MKGVQVADKVYNVGVRDPNLRNFHGYLTPHGSTYNSYLIIDEKITLIDTVHYKFSEQFTQQVRDIIDILRLII
jgi:flavorubredoxin